MSTKKVPGKPATAYIYQAESLLHMKSLLNKWDILNIFSSNLVFIRILVYVQFQIYLSSCSISNLDYLSLWCSFLSKKKKKIKGKKGKKIKPGQFSCLLIMLLYIKIWQITGQKLRLVVKKKSTYKVPWAPLTCFIMWAFTLYNLYIFCYMKILFLAPIFLSFPVYILLSTYIKSLWIPSMEKTLQIYLLPKCKTWI